MWKTTVKQSKRYSRNDIQHSTRTTSFSSWLNTLLINSTAGQRSKHCERSLTTVLKMHVCSQAMCLMSIILVLRRTRQKECHESETSLDNKVRTQKKNQTTTKFNKSDTEKIHNTVTVTYTAWHSNIHAHTCNLNTKEAKSGCQCVPSQPRLHSKIKPPQKKRPQRAASPSDHVRTHGV